MTYDFCPVPDADIDAMLEEQKTGRDRHRDRGVSSGEFEHLLTARAQVRDLGYAPEVPRAIGVARMRAAAASESVRHGPSRASFAARTLVSLALAAAALTTTAHVFAAPPTDPTGLWQLYDDRTGKPNGVVRLYIEEGTLRGRIERLRPGSSPQHKCTECPPPQKDKPFLGLCVAWGSSPTANRGAAVRSWTPTRVTPIAAR